MPNRSCSKLHNTLPHYKMHFSSLSCRFSMRCLLPLQFNRWPDRLYLASQISCIIHNSFLPHRSCSVGWRPFPTGPQVTFTSWPLWCFSPLLRISYCQYRFMQHPFSCFLHTLLPFFTKLLSFGCFWHSYKPNLNFQLLRRTKSLELSF